MTIDFYYALLTGLSILLIFWITIIVFIFLRNPPKSKLTKKLSIISLLVFLLGYIIIIIFS